MADRRPGIAKLLLGRWNPDNFLTALPHKLEPWSDRLLAGIHVFPFGGLQQSVNWLDALNDTQMGRPASPAEATADVTT